jgi:UDP-N-acetylglucosamine--N-acetylmuramyl-(pentapeptide) pyrophosphoryl-undecaprenol N-acetylglucosamine transferase
VSQPIVLTGGGTGGHVFPLRAIAEALFAAGVAREDVVVVGSGRGQDGVLLADLGVELVLLPGRGLRRSMSPRGLSSNVSAVGGLVVATARGVALVSRRRPRAIVSVGGYAAFAASVGAVLTGTPLVLVDLDAAPGLVHRVLRRFAVAIATAFPSSERRSVVTGTPLRDEIVGVVRSPAARDASRERLGVPVEGHLVAVMSGSLGAGSVNRAVAELAARWRDAGPATLYQVTGRRDVDDVLATKMRLSIPEVRWRVVGFESHMADLWAACDVAVCRAGATTVAELCATGVPSVLVPLPNAPGAHQHANAAVLADAGAAVVLEDDELSAQRLDELLTALLADSDRMERMSRAARSLSRPDAARRVAQVVLDRAR